MMFNSLFINFLLILGCVCGFTGIRNIKLSRMIMKPLQVSTESIPINAKDAPVGTKAEGTMMKSPAFKILDFIMSIPIVHGEFKFTALLLL